MTSDFFLRPVFLLVFLRAVQSQQIRSISPGQKWPGFCFARMQYSSIQAFTTCFAVSMQLYRPHSKTAYRALQRLFLRLHPLNRPRYQTDKSGYNTTCATLKGTHTPGRTQQIPATPDAVQASTAAYYNNVYKGADHARRCSISQTMPARRALDASHARQGSPAAGARRAARNHWRLPPYLFSGFRPIANKGEQ